MDFPLLLFLQCLGEIQVRPQRKNQHICCVTVVPVWCTPSPAEALFLPSMYVWILPKSGCDRCHCVVATLSTEYEVARKILYYITLYYIILHYIILYYIRIMLFYILLNYIISYYIILYCIILYYIILYSVILYYILWYYTILYYIIL